MPDNLKNRYPLIRPMLPSDLDTVIRIEEQSFPHPWTFDQFMSELQRESVSRCHVAVMEDQEAYPARHTSTGEVSVVGFIMAWLAADELHITNLAVAPEARRCGVASALLQNSIREAVEAGADWCQLEVKVSNTPARGLYVRSGFKPLGIRKGYYHNGEDAVVMGKELKPESGV